MGQYWILVNLSKGEYIQTVSSKLLEIAADVEYLQMIVALLAGSSNGAGSGDLKQSADTGRWAGDRLVFAGDYGERESYIAEDIAEDYGERKSYIADVAKVLATDLSDLSDDRSSLNLYEFMMLYGKNITSRARKLIRPD